MLAELTVKQFALIEEVRLSLEPGLNILTGETGAGKSILLDALSLILGGRASSDLVRKGADRASIEALFAVSLPSELSELLEEYGIEAEDGQLIVSRELSVSGKNVCRINGRMVTVQMLKLFGQYLIHMHGQHEHQTLSDPREQLALIDAYGGDALLALREETAAAYHEYREAKQRLHAAKVGEQERIQRIDILRFQADEIREAHLRVGEDVDLDDERRRLAHSEKLYAAANNSYERLYAGAGRNASVLDQLNSTINDLEGVTRYDEGLSPVLELVKTALYHVEEAAHTLRSYRDEVEFNPGRLAHIEERLNVLKKLQRKYGESVEDILAHLARVVDQLSGLEHYEENLERLEKDVDRTARRLAKSAVALSKARRSVAQELSEDVMDELAELMMPKVQFAVTFTQIQEQDGLPIGERRVHVSEFGIDRVDFLFSSNPGEPLRPLAKIASGGELSRTMLAIKSILANADNVGTLIFDEVDTGISGRAAQAVAEKLAHIGQTRQVLCVTHLPQVAAMADTHYLIQKQQGERTHTEVFALSADERVQEIARMLSGAELTATTLRHAEEMVEQARVTKLPLVPDV